MPNIALTTNLLAVIPYAKYGVRLCQMRRSLTVQALDEMAARSPRVVIPGHMQPDAAIDASAIQYTRDYLLAFEEELAKANNSDELIEAMTRRYPNAKLSVALQIGAKVAMGEMNWG